jgi:hypothetical protein
MADRTYGPVLRRAGHRHGGGWSCAIAQQFRAESLSTDCSARDYSLGATRLCFFRFLRVHYCGQLAAGAHWGEYV